MNIQNTKAFSLIEVMVSVAILGVMSLGIMSMTDYGFKSQAAVEQKFAANSLQSQIYNLLASSNVCNLNFGLLAASAGTQVTVNAAGSNPGNVNVTNLNKTNTGVPSNDEAFKIYSNVTKSPTYENNSIRIQSMQLQNFQLLGNAATSTTDAQYDLVINIEKNKSSTGVQLFAPRIIKLKVTLTPAWAAATTNTIEHKIDTCLAVGGTADQIWTKNADNTIFYNGGNVGIGINPPTASLDVATGQIRARDLGSAATPSFGVGDVNTGLFRTGAGQGIGFTINGAERMRIDPIGNLGIGSNAPTERLEVQGGVVVSGTRVNPVTAGTAVIDFETPNNFMRFNTNNQDIAFNTAANGTLASERLRVLAANGNVGIGTANPTAKLEVNGGIKPGSATIGAACSPAGAMAYDATADTLVYCKASPNGWTSALSGFVGANVHSFPTFGPYTALTSTAYDVSSYNFSYINFDSQCQTRCNNTRGFVKYRLKNSSNAVIYSATVCFAGDVSSGVRVTAENIALVPKANGTTRVEVDVQGCGAGSTRTQVSLWQ